MKYAFTDKEVSVLKKLAIPFDPFGNLTESEEDFLCDCLSDYFGSVAYEPEGDVVSGILDSMGKQAK